MYDFWAQFLGTIGGIAAFLIAGLWLARRRGRTPTIRNRDLIGVVGEYIACDECCPWCGTNHLVLDVAPDGKYHVACDGCAIWGPAGAGVAEAVTLWDKRS